MQIGSGHGSGAMASFFAREKDLSVAEMEELISETRKELSANKEQR